MVILIVIRGLGSRLVDANVGELLKPLSVVNRRRFD